VLKNRGQSIGLFGAVLLAMVAGYFGWQSHRMLLEAVEQVDAAWSDVLSTHALRLELASRMSERLTGETVQSELEALGAAVARMEEDLLGEKSPIDVVLVDAFDAAHVQISFALHKLWSAAREENIQLSTSLASDIQSVNFRIRIAHAAYNTAVENYNHMIRSGLPALWARLYGHSSRSLLSA